MVQALFSGVCGAASKISRSRISDRISRAAPPQVTCMVTLEPLNTEHFLHRFISRLRSSSGIAQGFLEPNNSAHDCWGDAEALSSLAGARHLLPSCVKINLSTFVPLADGHPRYT